ncbi:MAG TPA: DUF2207 domain-containing protein [Acidimicrobiales bacterium]|jgi:uncharacterized membrane protein
MWRPARAAPTLSLFVLVVALALAGAAARPAPAAAQTGAERIDRYDVEIGVGSDGALTVTEVIAYDFGGNARHGIFRDIPVRFHYDDRYDRVMPIEVLSVDGSEGTPDHYEVEDEGAAKRIRIGDEDETITGPHTYRIRYRVDGALNGFPDHDELYWNAVGHEWSVPIGAMTARVTTPSGITQVTCFAGSEGSQLPCGASTADGTTASFTNGPVGPFQGLTVVVGFEPGAVPAPEPILDERWSFARAFAVTPATVGGSVALLAAVLGGFATLAWRAGRDRRYVGSPTDIAFGNTTGAVEAVPLMERTETPVEFAPPDGLRPGQVGTLVDEAANPLDVTATIVDLAVRGYLRIEEIPKQGWFGKPDWRLVKLREGDGLLPYEALLFDALFEDAADGTTVQLSDLRNKFRQRLTKVQDALYEDAVRQGWFTSRPDRVRAKWVVIGALVLSAGIGLVVVTAIFTHAALVAIPVALLGLLLLIGARRMPHRTAKGTGVLRRVAGFRIFMEESEAQRAQFAERAHLFTEYLPYAVVFGCTEKWAKAFAGLEGQLPEQHWYVGHHAFTTVVFADAMDSFSVTTAGTLTSVPASSGSSGFGGGGFSGGGGGGGGGGSW